MNHAHSLEEPFHETDRAKLLRWVPWLHLLRAFRLSTRWQNLVLASLALLTLTAGHWGIARLPLAKGPTHDATNVVLPWQPTAPLPVAQGLVADQSLWSPIHRTIAHTIKQAIDFRPDSTNNDQGPIADLFIPASKLTEVNATWATFGWAWTEILLTLTVWSFFAGALTRRVLLEFSGQGEIGLRESLRFAAREFTSTLGAPTIGIVGIGTVFFFGRCIGWIGAIPAIGSVIGPLFLGLQFVLALVLAFIVFGLAVCWPLMIASHSAEGTDGFDALNRAYNYLFVRPWYTLWMVTVSVVYYAAVLTFLNVLVMVSLSFAEWFNRPATELVDPSMGRMIQEFWKSGLRLLLAAFPYSFFWTATSLVYLLLRKSVDAYPLDRLFLPQLPNVANPRSTTTTDTDLSGQTIPLVGIPAAQQRENQQPQPQSQPQSD